MEGGIVGVEALLDQPGFVVGPGGATVQGVDVAEQTALGIVFETVSGLVGIQQAAEMARLVVIVGFFTRGIDQLRQLSEGVVFPLGGLPEQSV